MANTLAELIPSLYCAADVVSREMVGFIPAVTLDADCARGAVGQQVISAASKGATASDITPGVTPPDDGDQEFGNKKITITKARKVPVRWNGEQSLGLNNNGPGRAKLMQDQFVQAMRTLVNEIESDLAALYKTTSRAYGTAGTAPFGTAGDFTDAAQMRKILADNGAPLSGLQMVLNTTAGASFRGKQSQSYMAGTDTLQRQGILLDVHGFQLRESAKVVNHAKGTGASYQTNLLAGLVVGDTAISLDTGTGTMLAGDVVTFEGDSNKYVVASALSAGALSIGAPGLQATLADGVAATVGNSYAANMAFSRSAIHLATRAPALPEEGDLAVDRTMITDPLSGITFEVSMYLQYRQVYYEVAIAWGVQNFKPEHTALLLG